MPKTYSSSETTQSHEEIFGKRLGTVYDQIYRQSWYLFCLRQLQIQLFGNEATLSAAWRATAPVFFRFLDGLLTERILLQLSALTDPPRTNGNQNISVKLLPELIEDRSQEFREEIGQLVKELESRTGIMRKWRNKIIAHFDLSHVTSREKRLAPVEGSAIDAAIEPLRSILRKFYLEFDNSQLNLDYLPLDTGSLIHYLQLGQAAERTQFE